MIQKAILFTALCFSSFSFAAQEEDIDKLTTYAVLLGRASACNIDVTGPAKQVGAWLDRTFPRGSEDQQIYLPIFMAGMTHHAKEQKNGKSPDTCADLKRTISKTPWPR